jgi:hypothetical protein
MDRIRPVVAVAALLTPPGVLALAARDGGVSIGDGYGRLMLGLAAAGA